MGVLKDYTRKDITSIREYLISKVNDICDKYGVDYWTDRNESDLGMLFVELSAGLGDMLNYQIDKQSQETYLPTVVQRKNAKGILSLINYEMKPPVSAITTGHFELSQTLDKDLEIPKYFQLCYERSSGNIYYATNEDCTILKGTTSVDVPLIQGIVNTINLTVSDIYGQRMVIIGSTKVAYNSIRLIVGDKEWTQVDDVLLDEDYGTKFSVHENEDDKAYIEFGYSWRDYLPADKTTSVVIQYIDTEGAYGAVKKNTINTVVSQLVKDGVDYTDYLTITNTDDASGGDDRESVDTARLKAPATVKTHNLMVTLEDYETITENYSGVYLAKAVDWNVEDGKYVTVPYEIHIYVVSSDKNSYSVSDLLLSNIKSYLDKHKWSTIKIYMYSAKFVTIDINATVYTSANKSNFTKIRRDVEDAVTEYFKKSNRDFGEYIQLGSLETLMTDSNSMIDYSEISSPASSIKLEQIEFPVLGELNITVSEEG